jgi:hypothetical protein
VKDQFNIFEKETRRREVREEFDKNATLQIIESSDTELVGETIETTIADISSTGFRLEGSRSLGECTVGVWIDLADESESFFLAAAVRWSTFEDGSYQIGLELIDHALAERERWLELWETMTD